MSEGVVYQKVPRSTVDQPCLKTPDMMFSDEVTRWCDSCINQASRSQSLKPICTAKPCGNLRVLGARAFHLCCLYLFRRPVRNRLQWVSEELRAGGNVVTQDAWRVTWSLWCAGYSWHCRDCCAHATANSMLYTKWAAKGEKANTLKLLNCVLLQFFSLD